MKNLNLNLRLLINLNFKKVTLNTSTPNRLEPSQANKNSCFSKDDDEVDGDSYFKKTSKKIYLNKKEKLKQFTISVFVDSFEDYSFNKSSSDTSSSTINNNESPKEKQFQQNHATTVDPLLVEDVNSLKEFEFNEARTIISTANTCNTNSHRNQSIINIEHDNGVTNKKPTFQATQIYDDDVFMFQSRPTNFNAWNNASILASKPPLMPTQIDNKNKYGNDVNSNDNNNVCLSTIIEGSVETFETCSNQSRDRLDDVIGNNTDAVGIEQNITIRKESSSKTFKPNDFDRANQYDSFFSPGEEREVKEKVALKSLTEILNNLDDYQDNESNNKNEKDSFFMSENLG